MARWRLVAFGVGWAMDGNPARAMDWPVAAATEKGTASTEL